MYTYILQSVGSGIHKIYTCSGDGDGSGNDGDNSRGVRDDGGGSNGSGRDGNRRGGGSGCRWWFAMVAVDEGG